MPAPNGDVTDCDLTELGDRAERRQILVDDPLASPIRAEVPGEDAGIL